MPVIAIVNRKGGSGKSTLATNIAALCAKSGLQVMLGDVDRQRSVDGWLGRRSTQAPTITSWAVDRSKVLRPPAGTTHVVLDTPGALYDHDLARLTMNVSAMVVPIGPSVFDIEASLQFLSDLRKLPRVSTGRCRVIAVGMRWPQDKRQQWLANGKKWDTQLLTVIPEAPIYRTCLDTGASIFEVPESSSPDVTEPWEPLLRWLQLTWSARTAHIQDLSTQSPAQLLPVLSPGTMEKAQRQAPRAGEERLAGSQLTPMSSPQQRQGSQQIALPLRPHKSEMNSPGWLSRLLNLRGRSI